MYTKCISEYKLQMFDYVDTVIKIIKKENLKINNKREFEELILVNDSKERFKAIKVLSSTDDYLPRICVYTFLNDEENIDIFNNFDDPCCVIKSVRPINSNIIAVIAEFNAEYDLDYVHEIIRLKLITELMANRKNGNISIKFEHGKKDMIYSNIIVTKGDKYIVAFRDNSYNINIDEIAQKCIYSIIECIKNSDHDLFKRSVDSSVLDIVDALYTGGSDD